MSETVRVTLFGSGEAGSVVATDLVDAGVEVQGYDPAPMPPLVT